MGRPWELDRLLRSLAQQHLRPDSIIVVENTPCRGTAEVLQRHPAVRHLLSQRNLGGAGGFSYGILTALADGATHVWLMDDDGLPLDPGCLGALAAATETHRADVVAPVIVDIEDSSRLAFPYFVEGRRITTREGITSIPLLRQFAHLFNGTLVRAEAFARFGVPDYRLFVRGDETDFLHRVRRGGGLLLTVTNTAFRHPSGAAETVPLLGGRIHAVVPPDLRKQFYFFRNRGYLVRRHRLLMQALHDVLRYSLYFLGARRGDWRGLSRWCRLSIAGFREDFTPLELMQGNNAVQSRLRSPQSETSITQVDGMPGRRPDA
jgi:rhamnopyranosyl-N-acetylglucosaminyl-diphospho-decaprenol beta-1,3/1,4-galactofuranosyltransferase